MTRRVVVVLQAAVAGEGRIELIGGEVFQASNGNGDAARYWANRRAGRSLRACASTTARARDQRVTGRLPATSAGSDAVGSPTGNTLGGTEGSVRVHVGLL